MSNNIIFLVGVLINLCVPQKHNIPQYFKWLNDPEITKYLMRGLFPVMEKAEEKWFENINKNNESLVLLITTKDGKPIGNIGLHRIDWHSRIAEAGIVIGEKGEWGKGYGAEAEKMIIDYAFTALNLRKVYAKVFADNIASLRAGEKAGFKEESRLKEHIFASGKYQDLVYLSIFNPDT